MWSRAGPRVTHSDGWFISWWWLIHSPSQFWPTPINILQDTDGTWRILGTIPPSQQMRHKVQLPLAFQSSILFLLHLIICYPSITLRILCPDPWPSSVYVTYRPWETLPQVLCKTDAGSFWHIHQGQTLEIFSRKSHILPLSFPSLFSCLEKSRTKRESSFARGRTVFCLPVTSTNPGLLIQKRKNIPSSRMDKIWNRSW